MSMAIGHFAVGVTGTLLLLRVTGVHVPRVDDGIVSILGGLWAMLPDVGTVLGVGELDHTQLANLCWFHYFLDVHEFTDGRTGSALLVAVMAVTVVGLAVVDVVRG
ncbi:MAG: hypothetical protein ABEJ28_11070 [Salinigranum sp.]